MMHQWKWLDNDQDCGDDAPYEICFQHCKNCGKPREVDMSEICVKEWDWLAQKAHMLGGACAVLVGQLFGGMRGALIGAGIILAFAAVKEFYLDPKYENEDERADDRKWDIRDFAYYGVGTILALCLVAIAMKYQF